MKTRPDGWPLCPECGEDELYCLAQPACICADMGCYLCDFRGDPRTAPEFIGEPKGLANPMYWHRLHPEGRADVRA